MRSSPCNDLAREAQVELADAETERLIQNSDRTPLTLVNNVRLARQGNRRLSLESWRFRRAQTWQDLVRNAKARYAGVETVYQALDMLCEADVPTRTAYVIGLAARLGQPLAQATLDGLSEMGLLRLRHGLIANVSAEQVSEILEARATAGPSLDELLQTVEAVVRDAHGTAPAWPNDWVALAFRLFRADCFEAGEALATAALEAGADPARGCWGAWKWFTVSSVFLLLYVLLLVRLLFYFVQSSNVSRGIRENSLVLFVTKIKSYASACAAICVSNGPIGKPCASSCARIGPYCCTAR